MNIIKRITNFFSWTQNNVGNFKNSFEAMVYLFGVLIATIIIPLFLAHFIFEYLYCGNSIYDPVYHGISLPILIGLICSIPFGFCLAFFCNFIYIKFNYNKWSCTLLNGTLTFLTMILFVFILGVMPFLSEYINLYLQSHPNVNPINILEMSFYSKGILYIGTYWILTMVLCVKTTFSFHKKKYEAKE